MSVLFGILHLVYVFFILSLQGIPAATSPRCDFPCRLIPFAAARPASVVVKVRDLEFYGGFSYVTIIISALFANGRVQHELYIPVFHHIDDMGLPSCNFLTISQSIPFS